VKFSTKTRYGIRAMLEIASSPGEGGVFQKDISLKQDISNKYLDQIINNLKIAGLVINVHGKKSGYKLAKDPSSISMYDIYRAFDRDICVIDCIDTQFICKRQKTCIVKSFWTGLNSRITDYFKSISLQDLIDKKEDKL
jgi:Rrf2 family protein